MGAVYIFAIAALGFAFYMSKRGKTATEAMEETAAKAEKIVETETVEKAIEVKPVAKMEPLAVITAPTAVADKVTESAAEAATNILVDYIQTIEDIGLPMAELTEARIQAYVVYPISRPQVAETAPVEVKVIASTGDAYKLREVERRLGITVHTENWWKSRFAHAGTGAVTVSESWEMRTGKAIPSDLLIEMKELGYR